MITARFDAELPLTRCHADATTPPPPHSRAAPLPRQSARWAEATRGCYQPIATGRSSSPAPHATAIIIIKRFIAGDALEASKMGRWLRPPPSRAGDFRRLLRAHIAADDSLPKIPRLQAAGLLMPRASPPKEFIFDSFTHECRRRSPEGRYRESAEAPPDCRARRCLARCRFRSRCHGGALATISPPSMARMAATSEALRRDCRSP